MDLDRFLRKPPLLTMEEHGFKHDLNKEPDSQDDSNLHAHPNNPRRAVPLVRKRPGIVEVSRDKCLSNRSASQLKL